MTDLRKRPAPPDRDTIAADWVMRLQSADLSEEELSDWIGWCEADPLNRKAFEAMEGIWTLAGHLDLPSSTRVVRLRENDDQRSQTMRRFTARQWLAGAIATAAVLVIAIATPVLRPEDQVVSTQPEPIVEADTEARLETARGHVSSARLTDGSQVDLGGLSALTVRYSEESRLIIAERGEAFFHVAKHKKQPFVVQAGALTVTAVGTAFAVIRDNNSVSVEVTEGIVEVKTVPNLEGDGGAKTQRFSAKVAAGNRVLFDQGQLIQTTGLVDPAEVASWRQGRLEFRDEPLRLAAARLSRYTKRDIVIDDAVAGNLRVTGTAYADRVDAWLTGIQAVLPVKVQQLDDRRILIRSSH